MIETIRKLVETYGPSGHEDQIRAVILDEINDLADEVSVDALGNLIAWRWSGQENADRVMVAAHMDEIGVVITHVDEDNYLRFTKLGGILAVTLVGNRVRFVDGTVGTIYVEKRSNITSVPALSQLYIDVSDGGKGHHIRVGDAAGFDRRLEVRGDRLIAKSLDDRIGCAIQIEVMRQLKNCPNDVAFVFSVQEEVGRRGAEAAAYAVDPDVGFAIDVTSTGDTPKARMEVALGAGPAIKVMDGRMLAAPDVIDLMEQAAKKAGIATQREVLLGGTTDAASMQLTRAGVKAGCLSIPCRYIHTTSETVDYGDVQDSVKLMLALLEQPIRL